MGCRSSKAAGLGPPNNAYAVGEEGGREPRDLPSNADAIEPSPSSRRGAASAPATPNPAGQLANLGIGNGNALVGQGQPTIPPPQPAAQGIFGRSTSAPAAPTVPSLPVSTIQQPHSEGALLDVLGLPGSSHILSCGEDRSIILSEWRRASSGSQPSLSSVVRTWRNAHAGPVTRLCYLPGRGSFASASKDRTVKIWSLGRGSNEEHADDEGVGAKAGSSSSPPLPLATLVGHDLSVTALAYSGLHAGEDSIDNGGDRGDGDPRGHRLCTGSRDTTVRVWDLNEGRGGTCLYRAHRPHNMVTCVQWYPNGGSNIILQGAEDLRVRVWDTRQGASGGSGGMKEVQCLEGYVYCPLSLDVSPCGTYLLTTSKGFSGVGCEAKLWDLRGGKGASTGPSSSSSVRVPLASSHFSDPSHRAGLVQQYCGHLQDTTKGVFLPTPTSGSTIATSAETAPSLLFVTASRDGTVKLWDALSGDVLAEHCDQQADPSYGYGCSYSSLAVIPQSSVAAAGLQRASVVGCVAAGSYDGRVTVLAVVAAPATVAGEGLAGLAYAFQVVARTIAPLPSSATAEATIAAGPSGPHPFAYQAVVPALQGCAAVNPDPHALSGT